MIGMPFDTANEAAFSRAIERQLPACSPYELDSADAVCLVKDPSGGELRLGFRKGARDGPDLVTANPAFDGEGRAVVEVVRDVSDPQYKPFETRVVARFAGEETPLVFDLADPSQAVLAKPGKLTVSIAAFGFDPEIFTSEAAFLESQRRRAGKGPTFAANFFIPSGMFLESAGGVMPDNAKQPSAYADFAGTVLKSELRANAAGSGKFWWALVRTYADATVDVVMDPNTVRTEPRPGSILTGRFWITAHVVGVR
jgi:hypothetical protein